MSYFEEIPHFNGTIEVESFGPGVDSIYVATFDNSPDKSYTGESTVRLNVHQTRYLIQCLRQAVADFAGEVA